MNLLETACNLVRSVREQRSNDDQGRSDEKTLDGMLVCSAAACLIPNDSQTGRFLECDLMSEWQGHDVRFRSWYSCSESLKVRRVSNSSERFFLSSHSFPATDESFARGARFRQSGTVIDGDVAVSTLGGHIGIPLL